MHEQKSQTTLVSQRKFHDLMFLVVCCLLSMFYARTTLVLVHIDHNSFYFLLLYLLSGFLYTLSKKRTLTTKSILLFALLLFNCLPTFLYPKQYLLHFFSYYTTFAFFLYWLQGVCGHHVLSTESSWILLDLFHALLYPIRQFPSAIRFLSSFLPGKHRASILKIFIGILLGIPLLQVISSALEMADPTFAYFIQQGSQMFEFLFSRKEWLYVLLRAIPMTLYCFSACYGHLHQENISFHEESTKARYQKLSIVPSTIYHTIELMLILLYLIFLLSSVHSILTNIGVDRFTFSYASFARQGFFELCVIASINLTLFLLFHITCKEHTKFGNILERMICVETMCLILSAMIKLFLYILTYQAFTLLRIYATWFLIVLFGIFVCILIGSMQHRNMMLVIVRYCCICFLMLNFCNVDRLTIPQRIHTSPFAYETQ